MDELSDFKYYMDYQWKYWTYHYVTSSKIREGPLKKIIKELFTPKDRDNQDTPNFLEKLNLSGVQALLDELEDDKKSTFKYLSLSGS